MAGQKRSGEATEAGNRPLNEGEVPPQGRAPPAEPEPPPGAAPAAGGAAAAAAAGQAAAGQADWQIVPVTPTDDAVERRDVQFRIGSRRNGFIYTWSSFTFMGNPVYQCQRGSGLQPVDVYWLYRCAAGPWICVEAFIERTDPIRDGAPQFKPLGDNIDDISVECDALAWQHWDERSAVWSPDTMMFPTTRL